MGIFLRENVFLGDDGDFDGTLVTSGREAIRCILMWELLMTTESHLDLRNAVRFPLHLRVTLKTPTAEHRAETIDISAGGILFRTETPVEVGSSVEFTVAMPGGVLGSDQDVLVKCQGRVVRCTEDTSGWSVAIVIDEYNFERH